MGMDDAGFNARFGKDFAVWRDDQAMSVGFAAVFMPAPLRRGQHIAAGLDGACPKQRMPMRLAGLTRECRGHRENCGAGLRQQPIKCGETQVVADRHAKLGASHAGDHRFIYLCVEIFGQAHGSRPLRLEVHGGGREGQRGREQGVSEASQSISFAAMSIGVILAPISPNYTLMPGGLARLKDIAETLRPNFVFVQSGRDFSAGRAIPGMEPQISATMLTIAPPRACMDCT